MQKYLLCTLVTVFWLVFDQLMKWWVIANIPLNATPQQEVVLVPGYMFLTHVRNTGMAFSLLEGQRYGFIVITVVILGYLIYTLVHTPSSDRYSPVIIGFILGGALGNFIDRVRFGYVVDMVKNVIPVGREWLITNFGTDVWPIYNIADAALLIGMLALFVHSIAVPVDEEPTADPESEPTS